MKNLSVCKKTSFLFLNFLARYRRKLRSKFDTVKKQFSDQHHSHGLTFDDIGNLFLYLLYITTDFSSLLKYFNRFRTKSIIA